MTLIIILLLALMTLNIKYDNDYNLSIYREILLEYKEILLLIKEKSMAEIREISKSSGIIW